VIWRLEKAELNIACTDAALPVNGAMFYLGRLVLETDAPPLSWLA
jgi:hypothetical protein